MVRILASGKLDLFALGRLLPFVTDERDQSLAGAEDRGHDVLGRIRSMRARYRTLNRHLSG